jgi:hypothetical protein
MVARGFQEEIFGDKIFNSKPQNTSFNLSQPIFPFLGLTEFVIISPFIFKRGRRHNEDS